MVLEALVPTKKIHIHPSLMFLPGLIYPFIGIGVSIILFPQERSLLAVALTAFGASPYIYRLLRSLSKELALDPGNHVFHRHKWIFLAYFWFFLGEVVAFALAYLLLPPGLKASVFARQETELERIAGIRSMITGMAVNTNPFFVILTNNLFVYALSIFLSFFYGLGAIFLITWNASVVGTLIAQQVMVAYHDFGDYGLLGGLAAYGKGVAVALSLIPHGSLEFLAYFVGGVAGAVLSYTLVVEEDKLKRRLLYDFFILASTGVVLLFAGALIETLLFFL